MVERKDVRPTNGVRDVLTNQYFGMCFSLKKSASGWGSSSNC